MRGLTGIYSVAGALLVAATILAALRVGEEPGALSDWQALVLGIVQGSDGTPADLVVRAT